jgi:hypothetical protein
MARGHGVDREHVPGLVADPAHPALVVQQIEHRLVGARVVRGRGRPAVAGTPVQGIRPRGGQAEDPGHPGDHLRRVPAVLTPLQRPVPALGDAEQQGHVELREVAAVAAERDGTRQQARIARHSPGAQHPAEVFASCVRQG